MHTTIKLSDLVGSMETLDDESELFVNSRNGEVLLFNEEEITAAEAGDDPDTFPEWRREMIVQANEVLDSDDYIEMNAAHEIDDYEIMRDFCDSISDEVISDQLHAAIRGRGAFRLFRQSVEELGLLEEWYAFKLKEYEKAAVTWCEENNFNYC